MAQELAQTLLKLADEMSLTTLSQRLSELPPHMIVDLMKCEQGLLAAMDDGKGAGAGAARYLLSAGGKRVRPLMCLLAARLFKPDGEVAHVGAFAQVAEMIHSATLLHDDVIDLGDMRRGKPAARLIFGNAVAVLGGDLLLVRSVATVEKAHVAELLQVLLDVLNEMITAETLQLERRGRWDVTVEDYFEVVRGKTGALFRWCMESGSRAADAPRPLIHALRTFAYEVGTAFQLVDDLLDLANPADTGKSVMQDVAGGTLTYPVILALEARPELRETLEQGEAGPALDRALQESCARVRTRREIEVRTQRARAALSATPAGWARDTLGAFVDELALRGR